MVPPARAPTLLAFLRQRQPQGLHSTPPPPVKRGECALNFEASAAQGSAVTRGTFFFFSREGLGVCSKVSSSDRPQNSSHVSKAPDMLVSGLW